MEIYGIVFFYGNMELFFEGDMELLRAARCGNNENTDGTRRVTDRSGAGEMRGGGGGVLTFKTRPCVTY
jgi:hypothetical protein